MDGFDLPELSIINQSVEYDNVIEQGKLFNTAVGIADLRTYPAG